MKNFLLYSLLSLIFVSCGPQQKKEKDPKVILDEKFDEVMAVHDEVMPKMSDIRKLTKGLEGQIEEIAASDSLDERIAALKAQIERLNEADAAMMNWMRNFSQPAEELPLEEALKFYEKEMEKVIEVREVMLKTIKEAQALN